MLLLTPSLVRLSFELEFKERVEHLAAAFDLKPLALFLEAVLDQHVGKQMLEALGLAPFRRLRLVEAALGQLRKAFLDGIAPLSSVMFVQERFRVLKESLESSNFRDTHRLRVNM